VILSIIIVNWNSVAFLRKCLASIYSDSGLPEVEVIVVDNASFDGSKEVIRSDFPKARFVQSHENLGFARANNLGYAHSSGRTLLFLNPDTEVRPGALSQMVDQLWSTPQLGGVGCRLLNTDLSVQTTCLQAFPTISNQLLDSEYLKRVFPRWEMWGMRPLFSSEVISDDVQMISGACLMIKRKAFEKAGLFSTDYFMYGDDVDLCYKITHAGYVLRYVATAEVIHHGGKSSSCVKSDHFADVLIREAIWRFVRKTRSPLYAAAYRVATAGAAFGRVFVLLALWPVTARRIGPPLSKWFAILRWTFGGSAPIPTTP
jgi:GT2 family glycosyltransferase